MTLRAIGACCLVALVSACSGSAMRTAPSDGAGDVQAAREAVARAEVIGAAAAAPTEMQAATARLDRAEAALAAGDQVRAGRLAREAATAARLAESIVLAERAARARVLYGEVRTLRAAVDSALGR